MDLLCLTSQSISKDMNLDVTEVIRPLICLHSAADLYITDYLDPFIAENKSCSVRVLRVYYQHRRINTASETLRKYCLLDSAG